MRDNLVSLAAGLMDWGDVMSNLATPGLRKPLVALAVLTVAAAGVSCKSTSTATTTQSSAGLFAKLPAAIQSSKVIQVGSDVGYAPIEFFKEGTQEVEGVDYDIGQALGSKLGVKVTFVNTPFDGQPAALKAKRFDMVMSARTDTKTREAEFDFVDYFTAGTGILVQKGNPKNINTLDDLCGKTVALEKGTTQADVADGQSTKCQAAGKAAINVLKLEKDTDALQQLKIGRSDADMNDYPVAAYNAKTSGGGNDFQVTGQQFQTAPYGITFTKDNTQLRDAVQSALKAIIADGTYDQVLSKWAVSTGALKTAAINGGTGT
jgi:polar amino acid transport system substrate-binding protein